MSTTRVQPKDSGDRKGGNPNIPKSSNGVQLLPDEQEIWSGTFDPTKKVRGALPVAPYRLHFLRELSRETLGPGGQRAAGCLKA